MKNSAVALVAPFGVAAFLLLPPSLASALPHNCNVMSIPAVASAHGVAGTYFRSDIWLLNQSNLGATFFLAYVCWGCPARPDGTVIWPNASVDLAAGEARQFSDVAATLFNAPETRGYVTISQCSPWTPATFFASSRTYTEVPGGRGTNGTGVPVISQSAQRAVFIGLASNGGDLQSGYRSNVGIVNLAPLNSVPPANVTLTLRDSSGKQLANGTVTVGGEAPVQINDIFSALGVPTVVTTNATLLIESSQPVYPYVTVIDNQSGDSTLLPFTIVQ